MLAVVIEAKGREHCQCKQRVGRQKLSPPDDIPHADSRVIQNHARPELVALAFSHKLYKWPQTTQGCFKAKEWISEEEINGFMRELNHEAKMKQYLVGETGSFNVVLL